MIIKSIELENYRNYEHLLINFDEGTNILYGDNAQGKTNILEAAFISGTTKSHRGTKDKEIICFDKEEKPGEEKYFNKLYKIAKKYEKYCKISFIYDRENRLELKDSPTDKGELVFKQLLERRGQI